ncbi:hypothetical protein GIB67_020508 [Kingdonia uniflora]|uniref:Uncharacterized protein n=1 Tax=Kingdonia uniflora TaxID=39325 RepID=A0A7J7PBJ0_9MAGN|nr:hypothetical protein GIB67_020508 [Kingdonia uniflora]
MEYVEADCRLLFRRIEFEEEQLNKKRRWLMGLPTTSIPDQKRLKTPDFLINKSLPESVLREDDVSSEVVKTSVERGFGVSSAQTGNYIVQDYMHLFDTKQMPLTIPRAIPSVLEDMNNIGLCNLATIITGSSLKFEKTRSRMSYLIEEHLPKILVNPYHKYHKGLLAQLPQILKDPHNFRENRVKLMNSTAMSHFCAATKLLEELDELPSEALGAMHRKLRGIQSDALKPKKSAWSRSRLIENVRNICKNMLSKVDEGDELQKPLAKAMAVVALSLRLKQGNSNLLFPKFCDFFTETEALQNDILKAIWSLDEMNIRNLKELQHLIDPDAKIRNSHFRSTIRRILTEYLFECSEMDVILKPLLEITAIINKRSRSPSSPTFSFSKEDVEEEVENVLNVSSQIRQISWDLLGDHKFDEQFADVYLENSDNNDHILDNNDSQIRTSCSSSELEGTDESGPGDEVGAKSQPDHICDPCQRDQHEFDSSFSLSFHESDITGELQNTNRNQYLAIQELCDETSLVAHQLIGSLLEAFLQIEDISIERSERSYLRGGASTSEASQVSEELQTSSGEVADGSVLVKVVEELLPSFQKR